MLLSPEILQSPEGRRSLSMRKAASQYTLCEFVVASAGSEGQSCFTMAIQSTGEGLRPLQLESIDAGTEPETAGGLWGNI